MNRDELNFVAAVCQKYGKRIDGGYEISISAEVLGNLPQHGIVQQLPPDPREPGVRIRYLTSKIIDGGRAEITPVEAEAIVPTSEPSVPETPPEPPQHIDEWA